MKKTIALVMILALLLGAALAEGLWICPACGSENSGNFCGDCGTARPVQTWTCPNCGDVNEGNFCGNCGTKRPEAEASASASIYDGVSPDALQSAARAGDADAMVALGARYEIGDGVEQSYATATYWYKQAAKEGSAEGWYLLGWMYAYGLGESQSYEYAAECWLRAARKGHADAMLCLADLYEQGVGVERSGIQAQRYRDKAAEAMAQPTPTPAPTPKPTVVPTRAPKYPSEYVGDWYVIQITKDGNSVAFDANSDSYMHYTLNADGTGTFNSQVGDKKTTSSLSWYYADGRITLADMTLLPADGNLIYEGDDLQIVFSRDFAPLDETDESGFTTDKQAYLGYWELAYVIYQDRFATPEEIDVWMALEIGEKACTMMINDDVYDMQCRWTDDELELWSTEVTMSFFMESGGLCCIQYDENDIPIYEFFEKVS